MSGIDPAILKEAAQWLTRFQANTLDARTHAEWQRWKDSSPEHARAWDKAERLLGMLRTVPPELARTLDRPPRLDRRQALKAALALAFVGPAGWLGWRVFDEQRDGAIATAVGQTRTLALADGVALTLNTDTLVRLEPVAATATMDATQRNLRLVRGELLLDTRQATLAPEAAFSVASDDGWLRLRSARLNLRRLDHGSQASVIDGQAQLQVAGQVAGTTLRSGQAAQFAQGRILRVGAAAVAADAWAQGVLYADDMRLADFLDELARYRHGYVVCDPAVAGLRISGVFQLRDSSRILAALQNTLPVQVSFRTQWWVSVGAAPRT